MVVVLSQFLEAVPNKLFLSSSLPKLHQVSSPTNPTETPQLSSMTEQHIPLPDHPWRFPKAIDIASGLTLGGYSCMPYLDMDSLYEI